MFEKEAEEYTLKRLVNLEDFDSYQSAYDRFENGVQDAFKDGAKFGYNKANEWHFVKDGDYPKENQECYFIYSNVYRKDGKISFSKSNIQVRTGIYSFFLDEETGEETTEPCFYDDIIGDEIDLSEVYAWKEIVLPELPKESK